jgi:DNA polymerase III epsilon subunit-like protein
MTLLAFVDTETTGLDRHEVWEVGLILRGHPTHSEDVEVTWQLPVDLGRAEADALRVGHFHERCRDETGAWGPRLTQLGTFATEFALWTRGATLVGANPAFDVAFLSRLLRSNGACPEWHYRVVDVESLVAGHTHEPIRGLKDSATAVGIDPEAYETHTAMGDAQLARDIYDAVMGVPVPQTKEAVSA